MSPPLPVESPCVRLCTLDRDTDVCVGCGRHIDEITGWQSMSEHEKLTVRTRAAERLGGNAGGAGRP
jgi:predicted Fe-S protein YdhL (DUF1289 family)